MKKVFQINFHVSCPSFLQIAIIGELETKAENAEEIFDGNILYNPCNT